MKKIGNPVEYPEITSLAPPSNRARVRVHERREAVVVQSGSAGQRLVSRSPSPRTVRREKSERSPPRK